MLGIKIYLPINYLRKYELSSSLSLVFNVVVASLQKKNPKNSGARKECAALTSL